MRASLVLVFSAIAGAAFSQNLSRAQMQSVRSACAADIKVACPGVQPGGGRIIACIKANPDKISQPCMDALVAAKAMQAQ
ncbi:hypothetical protein KHC23_05350 [Ancylobacter dichloromethanicus]|nr:hypothetical protein [Ancylobacter dichloromethanicus]